MLNHVLAATGVVLMVLGAWGLFIAVRGPRAERDAPDDQAGRPS